jgi:simple sugar transport system permease protein
VTVAANIYREGQTGGRGYIGLAAMIFGNWQPAGLAAGASLFGYADALKLRNAGAVHALLLLVAVLVAVIAARQAYRRRVVGALAGIAVAAAALTAYLVSDTIDGALVSFTPHLTTLLVLSLASQRLRPPAAEGVPYRRGGRS